MATTLVEKVTKTKHSGMCESQIPCRVQNQTPESFAGGASLYVLKREKSMRHTSPFFGGRARPSVASHFMFCQGNANSTVQPRSRSLSSLTVPSIETAVFIPGNVWSKLPMRPPLG